jgi:hypothetical protein
MSKPPQARSVRIFLPEGSPNGLVIAEIMDWNGKVLSAPRALLPDLISRPEASKTGVYILTGADPDRLEGIKTYVGEADVVGKRLRRHDSDEAMDFFDRAAIIVCSDANLTKAHVQALESCLIQRAAEAADVKLVNATAPSIVPLPEADLSDMAFFVDQLMLVLPLIGLNVFRGSIRPVLSGQRQLKEPQTVRFELDVAGAHAVGYEMEDGFVVTAGSTARRDTTPTLQLGYQIKREQLVKDGTLAAADGDPARYIFTAEAMFTSASAAASVVAGRSASRPLEWKVAETGNTYKEWRTRQLETLPSRF